MQQIWRYFTLFILIIMMNPAHSFLYLIQDEEINDSVLFTIDSPYDTGILNRYPAHDLEALEAHPDRWELYAASGDDADKAGYLYQVNPQNGELTEIGSTGFKEIEGLSFRADGTLWAWAKGDGLIQINPQTAESKLILPSEVEIEALTWQSENMLYLAQGTRLWKYDGQDMEPACNLSQHTKGRSIEALEMMPNNTLLVGLHGKRTLLQLNVLSVNPCFILKNREIESEHNDIEGIAYTKAEPLILWAPTSSPEDIKPNRLTEVRFAIGLSGGSGNVADIPPLRLEEITPDGTVNQIGPLYDDGKTGGDLNANDYFYTGLYDLNRTVEGEYCYRVRTEGLVAGIELVSDETCLWVVSFPTDHQPWSEEAVMVRFTDDTSISRIKEIFLNEGATVLNVMPDIKLLLVRIESDILSNVVTRFKQYSEVKFAMPDSLLKPLGNFPDDPKFYDLPPPEVLTLNSLKHIRATETWYVTKALEKVDVSVVDDGVDYNHEDLIGKVIKGGDYVDNDDDPIPAWIIKDGKPIRMNGHGTSMSSIIAANSNNGIGMTGVSWDSQIHAVRAHSAETAAKAFKESESFAKVINFSQGYSLDTYKGQVEHIEDLNKAIVERFQHDSKTLFVAAAGNDGINEAQMPCGLLSEVFKVFCIGGATWDDKVETSSNYYSAIDIFAPYYSTRNAAAGTVNQYGFVFGTSVSTALVSGAAALVWSLHKDWSASQVKKQLIDTAQTTRSASRMMYKNLLFNSFEGSLDGWVPTTEEGGYCNRIGDNTATHGEKTLICTTGESSTLSLRKQLNIPKTANTQFFIEFSYSFGTLEYPVATNASETDTLTFSVSSVKSNISQTLSIDTTTLEKSSLRKTWLGLPEEDEDSLFVGSTGGQHKEKLLPSIEGPVFLDIVLDNKGDNTRYPFLLLDHLKVVQGTALTISPAGIGGRLDVFEAVFGGSFESTLKDTGWTVNGSCYIDSHFGNFDEPPDREKFLVCMTFPNEESAWITREIDIPEGITSLPLSLDYNFLSQEYPGNGLSDWDIIELSIQSANGNVTRLVVSSEDLTKAGFMRFETLKLDEIGGIELPATIELPIGQTGWQTFSLDVPVTSGKGEIKIMLSSEGSGNDLHSVLLVDNIRFAR